MEAVNWLNWVPSSSKVGATRQPGTDKTDKTSVLSVLSVPVQRQEETFLNRGGSCSQPAEQSPRKK